VQNSCKVRKLFCIGLSLSFYNFIKSRFLIVRFRPHFGKSLNLANDCRAGAGLNPAAAVCFIVNYFRRRHAAAIKPRAAIASIAIVLGSGTAVKPPPANGPPGMAVIVSVEPALIVKVFV